MPAPAANGPQSAAAVALPPRQPRGEANGQANGGGSAAPVWSLESNEETQGGADAVPLAAKCDLHGTTRDVCCRELKGDDERHLIDPDIVRDVIMSARLLLPLSDEVHPADSCVTVDWQTD